MSHRAQRLAAGVLTGVGSGLTVALLDVALAWPTFDPRAALAAAGMLAALGVLVGLWLGVALCGLGWSQPLASSVRNAMDFVRVGSFHTESQKVAALLSTLLCLGGWLGMATLANLLLAPRIVRPTLEALALALVLGALALGVAAVRPAVSDVMEDLLELRARVWDRHLGVVSVRTVLGVGTVGVVAVAVVWRAPLYNVLYALDTGLVLGAAVAVVTLPLGLVLLTVRPGAWVLQALAGPVRITLFTLAVGAGGAWAFTLPAQDDVREALFEMGGVSAAVYGLTRPVDDAALASSQGSITNDEETDPDTDETPVVEAPTADGGPAPHAPQHDVAHVLFVSLDTVRADRLGLYGYARHRTSPNLDRFAEGGARFQRAYASGPCTSASFMGMITSTLPSRLRGLSRDGDIFTIPSAARSLAGRLRQDGWATRALLPVVGDYLKGIDRGFDRFDGSFHFADVMVDRAIKLLDHATAPRHSFTWVHLIDAHFPYENHRGFSQFGKRPEDLYAQEIAFMDAQLARLFAHLEADGWLRDTLVVVFSDHGEAFGEHGTRLHGNSLHDEEIHIPLIMRGPGIPARDVETPVSLLDLGPTVTAAAGVPWRGRPAVGVDLSPLLWGQGTLPPRRVLAEGCKPGSMMASIADEKMFYRKRSGLYFLYDLKADPQERRNLFKTHPQAGALAAEVKAELARRN